MKDLCFPQEGKKLFTSDGSYYELAHLGWGNFSVTSAGYCMGYKEASDLLIKEAIESRNIKELDTFIFPVIFLYRQYLE